MLAKTPLRDLMIDWLEQQKPSKRYDFAKGSVCACGQFAEAVGRYDEWINFITGHHGAIDEVSKLEWATLNFIAAGDPWKQGSWTFGKFLARLRKP